MAVSVNQLKGPIRAGRYGILPTLVLNRRQTRSLSSWTVKLRMTPNDSRRVFHVLRKYNPGKSLGEWLVELVCKEADKIIADNKDDAVEINKVIELMRSNHISSKPLNFSIISKGVRNKSPHKIKSTRQVLGLDKLNKSLLTSGVRQ